MSTIRERCPVCHTTVSDWASRCPKCRYHPDCDDRDCYNRAQDDVASIARYATMARHDSIASGNSRATWRRLVPSWLRRPGVGSA